jgi:hypothetical protein
MNDLRILRERQQAASVALDRASSSSEPDASAAMIAKTVGIDSYPSAAAVNFGCHPLVAYGAESEGTTPTFTTDTGTVLYAMNIGSTNPPEGTIVVLHAVGGRWIFRYDG